LEDWIADYDCSIIINSNYKDNPFLSETEKNRIEKRAKRDVTFRRVHIDCEYGVAEGLIFTNWKVIKRFPENINYEFGLDWGFTNDPSTLIKVATDRDCIYCDEIFYSPGLLNKDIVRLFEANDIKKRYDVIIADNSEPKSIEEIYGYNYNILPSQKGADSVRVGIDRIKSKELFVTERSTNMINELENYRWEVDKNGKPTNKPIDAYNHTIDATRYALEPRHDFEYKIA
jgi:phage terminase large subunit